MKLRNSYHVLSDWSLLEKHFLDVVNHFGVDAATASLVMGHMGSDEPA